MEVGVRLGQVSEFSLLIAVLAQQNELISREASYLVQATTPDLYRFDLLSW
jgi:predicted Kef-type K+ transport protein